jgi:hypothetical protein
MKLWERYQERRRRKTREAYQQEKERQKARDEAWAADPQRAMQDASARIAALNKPYDQSGEH